MTVRIYLLFSVRNYFTLPSRFDTASGFVTCQDFLKICQFLILLSNVRIYFSLLTIPNSFTNFTNYCFWKRLGEDVSQLLICRNEVHLYLFLLNMFPDKMVPFAYMLGQGMLYWISCHCNCTLIITINGYFSI